MLLVHIWQVGIVNLDIVALRNVVIVLLGRLGLSDELVVLVKVHLSVVLRHVCALVGLLEDLGWNVLVGIQVYVSSGGFRIALNVRGDSGVV